MQPDQPDYKMLLQAIFTQAPFIADLGIQLLDCGPGWCETELTIQPRHMQHNQFVHAGVQATMADHTAGASAGTLVTADERVLTVEFKINLLRPAVGERLVCRADVLKPGKTLTVAESSVYAENQEERKLVSKATVTLAVVSLPH